MINLKVCEVFRQRRGLSLAGAALLIALAVGCRLPHSPQQEGRTYGGGKFDEGNAVQQTSDGGYVIAGTTESYGAGKADVYLIKTGTTGDTLWTRTYGGIDIGSASAIEQTGDSGYVIVGSIRTGGLGDIYLIKVNAVGDSMWARTYGGTDSEHGNGVQQTADGGFIIAGSVGDASSYGVYRHFLIKTDGAGETLWTRTYGGTGVDYRNAVHLATDGGFIVAGRTVSAGSGGEDVYLMKTDAAGDTLWTRAYGGADVDRGRTVALTSDGGYIVTGATWSYGAGGIDVFLIKTDSLGNPEFVH